MTQLVRLFARPSRDGGCYTFCVGYKNECGKRVRQSLGHAGKCRAEQQRAQLERDLRMGTVASGSLKFSEFLEDSLSRTRGQIRESSLKEYHRCYQDFLRFTGNIDFQAITIKHGEQPDGNPYVFLPIQRYQFIQRLRQKGEWSVIRGKNPLNNFDRQLAAILKKAGIPRLTFHDLRRTCLTHWFRGGLPEFDVMHTVAHVCHTFGTRP